MPVKSDREDPPSNRGAGSLSFLYDEAPSGLPGLPPAATVK